MCGFAQSSFAQTKFRKISRPQSLAARDAQSYLPLSAGCRSGLASTRLSVYVDNSSMNGSSRRHRIQNYCVQHGAALLAFLAFASVCSTGLRAQEAFPPLQNQPAAPPLLDTPEVLQTVALSRETPSISPPYAFEGAAFDSLQLPEVPDVGAFQSQGETVTPELTVIGGQGAETVNPQDVSAWWEGRVAAPMRQDASCIPVDLDQLFALTAAYSERVLAVGQTPWIHREQITQAKAAFDPTFYNSARFDSTSEPVENTLTTGGPSRLEDDILGIDTGFRGQSRSGSTYSFGQQLGHKNSNSTFFLPNDQGYSRLFANLTQPLLQGRRIDVNRSLVLNAQFETLGAQAAYHSTLQKQLIQVSEVYWSLYTERASLLQRNRHIDAAKEIVEHLESRVAHDITRNQVLRARGAVASRTAEIARSEAEIRNLESRLRALVTAPELLADRQSELLPVQDAQLLEISFNPDAEVSNALAQRPELADLSAKILSAETRIRLARDQTKPRLDMIAEGYVAGRQGSSDILGAWTDQFSTGRPGFATGLVYERPVHNRVATAAVRQRSLELSQLHHLVNEAQETIRAEVDTAVRNVDAAQAAARSRQFALDAVRQEVAYLQDRWLSLGNDPRFGPIQLDELLRSQDRQLLEEQSLLRATVQFHRALIEVQRATGSLVRFAQ